MQKGGVCRRTGVHAFHSSTAVDDTVSPPRGLVPLPSKLLKPASLGAARFFFLNINITKQNVLLILKEKKQKYFAEKPTPENIGEASELGFTPSEES